MTQAEFKLHSCERKKRYTSKKEAERVIKIKKKQGYIVQSNFKPYECQFCDGWHLGHAHSEVKK
jgi:hypothetical protein